ncbi:MAG: peptidase C15 [Myxacorys californica WJT36-NPBG1]|jgi:pyroglutamyl-peptidase|nr:peptidase C15 [Myxacorys californica WJT36-NPBG1]
MKILLTSFDTWEAHQQSNSSDDLLNALIERKVLCDDCYFLKKILVDFEVAPQTVIDQITKLEPELVICCGMAESRPFLSVESTGTHLGETWNIELDLEMLLEGTRCPPHISQEVATRVSHDAGNFVCNYLYYSVLKHSQEQNPNYRCLFIHVPVLTDDNLETVIHDFLAIVQNSKRQLLLLEQR